jgi:hypothetical protein
MVGGLGLSLAWPLLASPPGGAVPPVAGQLAGEVKLAGWEDLGLAWSLELGAGEWRLRGQRPGVELLCALRPAGAEGWTWRVERGRIDLGELWPELRAKLGSAAEGWSVSGRVELGGSGVWSSASGPGGELWLRLRDGWARSDALEAELGGVELDLATSEAGAGLLPPGQVLRIARISVGGARVEALRLEFALGRERGLELAAGEAGFLGGRIRLRPLRLPWDAKGVEAAAEVEALRLEEAARLLPWLFEQAQGSLRGRVELSWDLVKGLRVRDGGLEIVQSEDAVLRLAAAPGLLTGSMERKLRFSQKPPWRWIALKNPAYQPLKDIEMGRTGLRIEGFQVTFWPDGVGRGRTAQIGILGRPSEGEWVKQVRMEVNFHGPWSDFLAFGLNEEFGELRLRFE